MDGLHVEFFSFDDDGIGLHWLAVLSSQHHRKVVLDQNGKSSKNHVIYNLINRSN